MITTNDPNATDSIRMLARPMVLGTGVKPTRTMVLGVPRSPGDVVRDVPRIDALTLEARGLAEVIVS